MKGVNVLTDSVRSFTGTGKRLLIVNRGEIACRIIASAKPFGFTCVVVFADPDSKARFVDLADEAYPLEGVLPTDTYLNQDRILDIAARREIDLIHPGYGFLSENAEFAKRCEAAGIKFVGPGYSAIQTMGDKAHAKARMAEANVPLVPGYHGRQQQADQLYAKALEIGFPLLIKASKGGGGKGMRAVTAAADFRQQLDAAKREAAGAFGSDEVLLEKLIEQPRHVEVQVFFDSHVEGVTLLDRDCSIQRRHQKVLEEAPAPGLSAQTRSAMSEAALRCGQAIQYCGAGTVEFLVDKDENFYFMEMNTRLQVEHPVTELITGIDLVVWQLKIALGEPLPLKQHEIESLGHAIEVRLYAEDASQNFLPAVGTICAMTLPDDPAFQGTAGGRRDFTEFGILPRHSGQSFIRWDAGIQVNDQISVYYDPMLAKLIAWGDHRTTAIQTLENALNHTCISGITTNANFLSRIIVEPDFHAERLTTHFIEQHHEALCAESQPSGDMVIAAAALTWISQNSSPRTKASQISGDPFNPWHGGSSLRVNLPAQTGLELWCKANHYLLELEIHNNRPNACELTVTYLGQKHLVQASLDQPWLIIRADGAKSRYICHIGSNKLTLFDRGDSFEFELPTDQSMIAHHGSRNDAELTAPMSGRLTKLAVTPNQQVMKGEILLVMEAMKMEHSLYAPYDGLVEEIYCGEGDTVEAQQRLIAVAPAEVK